jgi:very-short-patch-repair endonuclease
MYHSSAYARERDKIRQGVLEGLGWKLLRVWSTDWWTNKAKALNALHGELEGLLREEREKQKTEMLKGSEIGGNRR